MKTLLPISLLLPVALYASIPKDIGLSREGITSHEYTVSLDSVVDLSDISRCELDCEAHTDGNGSELLVFTDALCRTVLERRSAGAGRYADTYTISDPWGNPLVVLPPEASALMTNAYDPYGRLKASHVAETGTGLGPLLAEISFDAAGNPSSYKTEGGYTKSVKRDIRGNVSSWTTPFMSQELGYGSQGSCSDWTGRVTCRTTTVGTVDRRYDYSYSPQGFLTSAKYSSKARPADDFSATYAYDLNGNVTSAVRKSPDALSAKVSELVMSAAYEGNALSRLAGSDDASAPMESRMGINGIGSAAVTYDNAGRLSADAMRGISLITYNDIGMQELVATSQGDRALYSYLADGRKYGERCRSHDGTGNSQRVSMAGFEFGSMLLRFYDTPFGYYEPYNRILYTYIHDYQGNIVGIIDTSKGKLVQQTDYYPYGMPHSDGTGAELNRRKFGAKELMTEFGIDMYNFEARYLGLPIPAFQSPDPLAYKTPHVSPYSYCNGDPVNNIDPTGCIIEGASKSDVVRAVEDLRAMFIGEVFQRFRDLIVQSGKKQNGKSIAPISGEALSAAFNGITLNEDQHALVDMVVNTINSKDVHKVEYFTLDKDISYQSQRVYAPKFNSLGITSEIASNTSGGYSRYVLALCGEATTTPTQNGSLTLILETSQAFLTNRPATLGHEIIGHGRSFRLGYTDSNSQHVFPIQIENLILRNMGLSLFRDGTKHAPLNTYIPNYMSLPIFR